MISRNSSANKILSQPSQSSISQYQRHFHQANNNNNNNNNTNHMQISLRPASPITKTSQTLNSLSSSRQLSYSSSRIPQVFQPQQQNNQQLQFDPHQQVFQQQYLQPLGQQYIQSPKNSQFLLGSNQQQTFQQVVPSPSQQQYIQVSDPQSHPQQIQFHQQQQQQLNIQQFHSPNHRSASLFSSSHSLQPRIISSPQHQQQHQQNQQFFQNKHEILLLKDSKILNLSHKQPQNQAVLLPSASASSVMPSQNSKMPIKQLKYEDVFRRQRFAEQIQQNQGLEKSQNNDIQTRSNSLPRTQPATGQHLGVSQVNTIQLRVKDALKSPYQQFLPQNQQDAGLQLFSELKALNEKLNHSTEEYQLAFSSKRMTSSEISQHKNRFRQQVAEAHMSCNKLIQKYPKIFNLKESLGNASQAQLTRVIPGSTSYERDINHFIDLIDEAYHQYIPGKPPNQSYNTLPVAILSNDIRTISQLHPTKQDPPSKDVKSSQISSGFLYSPIVKAFPNIPPVDNSHFSLETRPKYNITAVTQNNYVQNDYLTKLASPQHDQQSKEVQEYTYATDYDLNRIDTNENNYNSTQELSSKITNPVKGNAISGNSYLNKGTFSAAQLGVEDYKPITLRKDNMNQGISENYAKIEQYSSFSNAQLHEKKLGEEAEALQKFEESLDMNVCEYSYQMLSEMDRKIIQIKCNIQQALEQTDLPMTKQLLLEILDSLAETANTADQALAVKAVQKIHKNAARLHQDSSTSYNLYIYLQKISNFLQSRANILELSAQAHELSLLNQTEASFWQHDYINKPLNFDSNRQKQEYPNSEHNKNQSDASQNANKISFGDDCDALKVQQTAFTKAEIQNYVPSHYSPVTLKKTEDVNGCSSSHQPFANQNEYALSYGGNAEQVQRARIQSYGITNQISELNQAKYVAASASAQEQCFDVQTTPIVTDKKGIRSYPEYEKSSQEQKENQIMPTGVLSNARDSGNANHVFDNINNNRNDSKTYENTQNTNIDFTDDFHNFSSYQYSSSRPPVRTPRISSEMNNQITQQSQKNNLKGNKDSAMNLFHQSQSLEQPQLTSMSGLQQQQLTMGQDDLSFAVTNTLNYTASPSTYQITQGIGMTSTSTQPFGSVGNFDIDKELPKQGLQRIPEESQSQIIQQSQINTNPQQSKMRFFDIAVGQKERYPRNHPAHTMLISQLWETAKVLPESNWEQFIQSQFDSAK